MYLFFYIELGFPKPGYKYKRLKVTKVQVQKVTLKLWVLFLNDLLSLLNFRVQVPVLSSQN